MRKKRNNLDTFEANYIYSRVILGIGKVKKFNDLYIGKKNNLIDEICLEVIKQTSKSTDDLEDLMFEITAYKLENKEKYYTSSQYDKNVKKPNDFYDKLNIKYDLLIKRIIKEKAV